MVSAMASLHKYYELWAAKLPMTALRSPRSPELVRFVEQLDHVQHTSPVPRARDARAQLQQAPGVGGQDQVRLRLVDAPHLAFEQSLRHLVLRHVVDSGAAAAHVRFLELDQLEPRHGSQQGSRRLADALRVPEVAGVLIRGPRPDGSEVAIEINRRQELGHVFQARAESLRA